MLLVLFALAVAAALRGWFPWSLVVFSFPYALAALGFGSIGAATGITMLGSATPTGTPLDWAVGGTLVSMIIFGRG